MYISNLLGQGVKGQNFEHKLTPLVLFTGPNFAGKTARLEAIRFAFLGHIPELGKQGFATWDMIKGRVELLFDNGQGITRTTRLAADTVKVEAGMIGGFELPDRPMPFLNGKEYFGLTEAEQIQYVFRVMNVPDDYSIEGIVADLRNISLEENTEHTETAKNSVVLIVETMLRKNGISAGLTELTKDKGVLKTDFAFYNKRAKETVGTVRILSELKAAAGDVSAETLQGIQMKLAEIGGKLAEANKAVGALSERAMSANATNLRRKRLNEELDAPFSTRAEEIAALQKKVDETKVPAITDAQVEQKARAHDEAASAAVNTAAQRDAMLDRINEVEENLTDLKKSKCCPTCKAAGKNWKVAAAKEFEAQIKGFKTTYGTLDKQVVTLRKKADKARDALNVANNERESRIRAEQAISDANRQIERIRADVKARQGRLEQMAQELAALPNVTPPTDAELNAAAAVAQDLKAQEDALKQQHASLVRLQHDLTRAEEAAAEHQKASAHVAVIKAVGEKLKERQRDMIDNLFGGLIERANYFTDGILNAPLSFVDGQVGKVTPTGFVGHKLFSGTEEALTYVAIAAALSKDAPIRLVLLDEMGRLDKTNKMKVAKRLAEAVKEGIIDQAIAVDTSADAYLVDESQWQVHAL
jgi:hypothetical protein